MPVYNICLDSLVLKKEVLKGRFKSCEGVGENLSTLLTKSSILCPLKGLCHEMNNFFEGLKNQISTFCICAYSYKFFSCLVMEKIKDEVLACFCENTY